MDSATAQNTHNGAHTALTLRAAHWIRTTGKMPVAFAEPGSGGRERPDAIGWNRRGWSILVECKTTVSDFERDVAKRREWAREGYPGMGQERYYMTPKELILVPEMILPAGWGLLEWSPETDRVKRVVRCSVAAIRHDELDDDIRMAEWAVLYPQIYQQTNQTTNQEK